MRLYPCLCKEPCQLEYGKTSIKPPPPPEGLIYFKRFEGVLIETGEGLIWEGELIQFSKDDGISSP